MKVVVAARPTGHRVEVGFGSAVYSPEEAEAFASRLAAAARQASAMNAAEATLPLEERVALYVERATTVSAVTLAAHFSVGVGATIDALRALIAAGRVEPTGYADSSQLYRAAKRRTEVGA